MNPANHPIDAQSILLTGIVYGIGFAIRILAGARRQGLHRAYSFKLAIVMTFGQAFWVGTYLSALMANWMFAAAIGVELFVYVANRTVNPNAAP